MKTNVLNRVRRALGRRSAKWLNRRQFTLPHDQPIISFTFDDFPRSALFIGGGLLERAGWVGTYYTSFGLMGKTAPTGEIFRQEDLSYLLSRGHEIGCHTFEHCPAWETSPDVYEASIRRNAALLPEIAPGASFQTHSYPVSFPPAATKRKMSAYFRACRCGGQTFNRGTVDLNYLSAFFIERSRGFIEIERVIEANAAAKGWLVFATHDVCDSPTPFGCTPQIFEKVVRCAQNSGALVLSVSEALDRVHAPKSGLRQNSAMTAS